MFLLRLSWKHINHLVIVKCFWNGQTGNFELMERFKHAQLKRKLKRDLSLVSSFWQKQFEPAFISIICMFPNNNIWLNRTSNKQERLKKMNLKQLVKKDNLKKCSKNVWTTENRALIGSLIAETLFNYSIKYISKVHTSP